jgi:hypothetical protein
VSVVHEFWNCRNAPDPRASVNGKLQKDFEFSSATHGGNGNPSAAGCKFVFPIAVLPSSLAG